MIKHKTQWQSDWLYCRLNEVIETYCWIALISHCFLLYIQYDYVNWNTWKRVQHRLTHVFTLRHKSNFFFKIFKWIFIRKVFEYWYLPMSRASHILCVANFRMDVDDRKLVFVFNRQWEWQRARKANKESNTKTNVSSGWKRRAIECTTCACIFIHKRRVPHT